jgi:hypothetical protein
MGVREKIANAKSTSWLTENMTEEEIQEIVIEAKEQIKLIDTLDKIRAELIQSIQNGTLKIESGNEELFHIIDKYRIESRK